MNLRECIFILFLLTFELSFNYTEKNVLTTLAYTLSTVDSENLGRPLMYGSMSKLEPF